MSRAYFERLNYVNDSRNCEPDSKPTFTFLRPDTSEEEIPLPFHWAVCPVCDGEGTHVNPAIDEGGLSADDFYEDPDFAEEYQSGAYDVTCNKCQGRRVVHEVDLDKLPENVREAYLESLAEDAAYESERRAEYLMGA